MLSLKPARKAVRKARELFAAWIIAFLATSLIIQPFSASVFAAKKGSVPLCEEAGWREPLNDDQNSLQLLERITFGPRPGDLERLRGMGLDRFLDEQLHPEQLDDTAVEEKVAALPTLQMSSEELVENYPPLKPGSQAKREQSAATANRTAPAMSMQGAKPAAMEVQGPRRVIMELAQEEVLRAVYSKRQFQEVMVQFWMNHFNIFAPKGADAWLTTSFERDTIRPRALGKFADLLVATAKSPAMLFYLDNWMSASPKDYPQQHPYRKPSADGRRAPRPYNGPFGYPRPRVFVPRTSRPSRVRGTPRAGQAKRTNRGLNENYARELMELHTLGVEGGYTEKDVIEVARCLTGWTIDRPRQGGGFVFRPQSHDFGAKVVLDHKIKSGHGIEDGTKVLHILAHHPATAHFISLKLCRRFVADDPPPELVDRAGRTFLKSGGDIRAVLKVILTSPEFYSQAAFRSKVKSPLELVASSLRALDGQTDAGVPLLQMIARMGQPMFQYQAPTGFPDRASTWINPGSLLTRINFAAGLAANRIPGTAIDWNQATPRGGAETNAPLETILDNLARRLFGGELSAQTRQAILAKVGEGSGASSDRQETPREISLMAGLVMASPEFQRR
jgi:uncharacterized protein (DUF1800 family)